MDRQPSPSARPRAPEALARDVAALAERFAGLGTKLGEAARELETSGAPPSDALVEDLGAADWLCEACQARATRFVHYL